MRVWGMHERTQIKLSATDRAALKAVVANRNSPQKHVWRAKIVLLTAAGHGTAEIVRRTGKAKTVIWRWQERFGSEGAAGLWRDKTRPSRIPPLSPDIARVKATTRSAISGLNGGMRDGRVLSRHSPAAPSEPNRSCQRQMTVLAFPVRRTISAVPCPAAVSRTILARQTCFCGLFRLATTAFNAARSVALSLIWVLSCIPQTRMTESAGESARESKSQIWSTSLIDDRPHRGFRRNRARSRSIPPRSHGDAQCEQAQDRAVRGELLVGTGGHARSGALVGELAGQSQARADGRRVWYRFSPPDRALEGLWRRHRLPGRHARDHHLGNGPACLDQARHRLRHRACAAVSSDHCRQGNGDGRPHQRRPLRAQHRGWLERRRIRHVRRAAARSRCAL